MGSLINNMANLGIRAKAWDPLGYKVFDPIQKGIMGDPATGQKFYGRPAIFSDTGVPTTDTAANLASQQDQLRNMQRGVLSNIYAGNTATPPTTGTRTLLGG